MRRMAMPKKPGNVSGRRAGFSFLELQVSFIVFGIALGGMAPVVLTHMKQVKKLEDRLNAQAPIYLVPRSDPWARKLGAGAAIQYVDPGDPLPVGMIRHANLVTILSIDRTLTSE